MSNNDTFVCLLFQSHLYVIKKHLHVNLALNLSYNLVYVSLLFGSNCVMMIVNCESVKVRESEVDGK
jgi:hypothetical protein